MRRTEGVAHHGAFARVIAVLVIAGQIAACATRPANIQPRYVSPLIFGQATCAQLLDELSTISLRLDPLKDRINRNATNDSIWVGTYVVAFVLLPFTFFLLKGDGTEFQEYSWLLGQHDAVQQQLLSKKCRT